MRGAFARHGRAARRCELSLSLSRDVASAVFVAGGVTILMLNLHPNVTFHVEVENLPAMDDPAEAASTPRLEFKLTSAAAPPPPPPPADASPPPPPPSASPPPPSPSASTDASGATTRNASATAAAANGDGDNGEDGIGAQQLEQLLSSTSVLLNGRPLEPDASGGLPRLRSTRLKGPRVAVPPLSVGFYVFPEAGAKGCMTEKQEKVTNKLKRAKRKHGAKPDEKKKAASSSSSSSSSAAAAGNEGGGGGGGAAPDCDGDPEYCRNYYQK